MANFVTKKQYDEKIKNSIYTCIFFLEGKRVLTFEGTLLHITEEIMKRNGKEFNYILITKEECRRLFGLATDWQYTYYQNILKTDREEKLNGHYGPKK